MVTTVPLLLPRKYLFIAQSLFEPAFAACDDNSMLKKKLFETGFWAFTNILHEQFDTPYEYIKFLSRVCAKEPELTALLIECGPILLCRMTNINSTLATLFAHDMLSISHPDSKLTTTITTNLFTQLPPMLEFNADMADRIVRLVADDAKVPLETAGNISGRVDAYDLKIYISDPRDLWVPSMPGEWSWPSRQELPDNPHAIL